jgi:hypothetical protein
MVLKSDYALRLFGYVGFLSKSAPISRLIYLVPVPISGVRVEGEDMSFSVTS